MIQEVRVRNNTYVLCTGNTHIPFYKLNDKEIILMDTGWYKREGEPLMQFFDAKGYRPAVILLTHSHEDHAGNAKYFKKHYGSEVVTSDIEGFLLEDPHNMKMSYSEVTVQQTKDLYQNQFFKADRVIGREDTSVTVAGERFGVVHTPGHSPWHICFVTPDHIAYVGDVVMTQDVVGMHKRIRMPYAHNLDRMLGSIRTATDIECEAFIFAHNGVLTDTEPCVKANLDHYCESMHIYYDILKRPKTIEEMIPPILKAFRLRATVPMGYAFMRQSVLNYLHFLEDIGAVEVQLDKNDMYYRQKDRDIIEHYVYSRAL